MHTDRLFHELFQEFPSRHHGRSLFNAELLIAKLQKMRQRSRIALASEVKSGPGTRTRPTTPGAPSRTPIPAWPRGSGSPPVPQKHSFPQ